MKVVGIIETSRQKLRVWRREVDRVYNTFEDCRNSISKRAQLCDPYEFYCNHHVPRYQIDLRTHAIARANTGHVPFLVNLTKL